MATVTEVEQLEVRPSAVPTEHRRFDKAWAPPVSDNGDLPRDEQHVLAMFCYEEPDSAVGRFVAKAAFALAKRQMSIHIFSRRAFGLNNPGIRVHAVGVGNEEGLIERVHEFTRRACNSFLRVFHNSSSKITLIGHEWSAFPVISLLHGIKNMGMAVSLHSLERQRSGIENGVSKWIEETELSTLREARSIIVHDPGTAEVVKNCLPVCAERIVNACPEMPMAGFQFNLDPGEVKKRFTVGPVDPTILYIGDLDERYGPNLLVKAMPMILRHNGQTRCIVIGDGELLWPLRVYSRYLLLDHAVRICGHLADRPLYELIHAVDVVAIPSTQSTPWWPIEAAWAASRPVVSTHEAAPSLLVHERNAVLVEPNEQSLAAGIQRVLSDSALAQTIARQGNDELQKRYHENRIIAQIEEAIGVRVSV